MSRNHCCEMMRKQLSQRWEEHPSPIDCPDTVVVYLEASKAFGLPIHDGGGSVVGITYCPWCGRKLSTNRMPS